MAPWLRTYGSYQGRECSTRPCHGSGYAHSALEHSQLTYGYAIGMSGMQLLRCWYCAIPGPCPTPPALFPFRLPLGREIGAGYEARKWRFPPILNYRYSAKWFSLISSPPGPGCVTPASHVYGHLRLMTNLSGLRCIIRPPSDHVWRIYGRIDGQRWVAPSSAFIL